MPKFVDAEVLEGLRSLQQKIDDGDKSVAYCLAQRDAMAEAYDREVLRVADLRAKAAAAKARLALPDEELTFNEATGELLTATEVAAAEAAAEAALVKP